MSAPILASRKLILGVVKDLAAAWPTKRTDSEVERMAAVWYDALGDLPDTAIEWAKKRAIQEEKFFPRVATIRELALRHVQFDRRQHDSDVARLDDGMVCPSCKSRYSARDLYRPMANPDAPGRPFMLTADGAHLLLEVTQRVLCDCAPPSYAREVGIEPPVIHVSNVGYVFGVAQVTSITISRQAVSA